MTKGKVLADRIESLRVRLGAARYVLTETDRVSYLLQLERLAHRLSEAQRSLLLHVGLLGGTGVGKSTLINALAGESISSVSDRRPHTDKIVVYRHQEVSLPEGLPRSLLRHPEQIHTVDHIRHMVLYDMPDFDSIRTEHLERVEAFLEHLDFIVWVTSLEKYGDLKFYEMLARCGKHQDNFLFVLNKADRLALSGGDRPPEAASLIGDFTLKLKACGIRTPRIHFFSATEASNEQAPAWLREDFDRFREALFRRKEQKEILKIKASNVEVEFEEIRTRVHAGCADLSRLQGELEVLLQRLAEFASLSRKRLSRDIDSFFTAATAAHLRKRILDARRETWPVQILRGLPERLDGGTIPSDTLPGWESSVSPEDPRLRSLRDELAISLDPLVTSLHRFGLSHVARQVEQIEREATRDVEHFPRLGSERLSALPDPGSTFWQGGKGVLRRIWQRLVLAGPALFLFLALAGPGEIEAWAREPGLFSAVRICFLAALGLFQPGGLASIAAFGMVEFLIALWLASRSVRAANIEVEALRHRLREDLTDTLMEHWQKRMDLARQLGRDVLEEIRTFTSDGGET